MLGGLKGITTLQYMHKCFEGRDWLTNGKIEKKKTDMLLLAQYRDELRKHPRLTYLFLELTDQCNMCCLHCGSSSSPDKHNYLPVNDVVSVLLDIKNTYSAHTVMICLTGGEPLLHPEFERFVRIIHMLGFPWGLTTNGVLITQKMVDLFLECGLSSVTLSLDGLEETNDWFRQSKGSYRKILNRIQLLRNNGIAVRVTTVVHKRNLSELEDIFHVLTECKIQSWRLVNIEPIGRASQCKELLLTGEDYLFLFDFIYKKRMKTSREMEVVFGCSHFLTEMYEKELRDYYFICGAGIYVASILHNGDIFSCLDIVRHPELIQGNIHEDSFIEVWENGFQCFRRDRTVDCDECRICKDRYICGGDSAHTWNFMEGRPDLCVAKLINLQASQDMDSNLFVNEGGGNVV